MEAGIVLGDLNRRLDQHGLALPNLGDIDRQTSVGAIATATHGTGATLQNISAQVEAAEVVTADGTVVELDRGDDVLAARVNLGALGAVSAVTLQTVPTFTLHRIDEPMPLGEVLAGFDELADANDHVEFFVFPHARPPSPSAATAPTDRPDPATASVSSSARNWSRTGSETCCCAAPGHGPVAGDDALLSPTHDRDSVYVAVHQYRGMPWEPYFRAVERLMLDLGGRPHWGKRHHLTAAQAQQRYPRFDDFLAVRDRLDPDRVFANAYTPAGAGGLSHRNVWPSPR